MQVEEALATRYSARAFLPTPVERDLIETVLKSAERTPSWANTQPWDVFVASGEALQRIIDGFAACYEQDLAPAPEVPRPTIFSDKAKACIKALGAGQRDGGYSEAFKDFVMLNHTFFRAPMVVFLCMDKVLSEWSLYDVGAYSQSFMLSATEHGLDTIVAVNLVHFPEVIRDVLQIPDNIKIIIGIAVGYADPSHDINAFRSGRRPFDDVVRFSD